MTASLSMSVFHQWLLADPASKAPACAIILHGEGSWPCGRMIQEIAEYLNEYDDEVDGSWLPATNELVEKIARDPNHRSLLGMAEEFGDSDSDFRSEFLKTLTALGRRGHVVFSSPGVSDHELELINTFHAGIDKARKIKEPCHLILNPDLIEPKCLAYIVGDVFLEWLHGKTPRGGTIQDIR
jgi:hypothetical protein